LKRAAPVALAAIRVPDFIGAGFNNLSEMCVCLDHQGSVDDCLAGTAFGGGIDEIPDPIPISRELAEFLGSFRHKIKWIPANPTAIGLEQGVTGSNLIFSVASQFPAPGTLVSDPAEISVHLLGVPGPE
jgi:hypothetical protein